MKNLIALLSILVISCLFTACTYLPYEITNFEAPQNVVAGQTMSVRSQILNPNDFGLDTSSYRIWLSYDHYLGHDVQLFKRQINGLAARTYHNAFDNVKIPNDAISGTYYLIIETTLGGYAYRKISITGSSNAGIDLVVGNAFHSNSALMGQILPVNFSVFNTGTQSSPNTIVRFYLAKTTNLLNAPIYIGEKPVPSVSAASEVQNLHNVLIPNNLEERTYYFFMVADAGGNANEFSELNNFFRREITISKPRADLYISYSAPVPTRSYSGNLMEVKCRVSNLAATNSGRFVTYFYLSNDANWSADDRLLNGFVNVNLNGATSSDHVLTLTIPQSTTSGLYYVLAKTDALNNVDESTESNNIAATPLSICGSGNGLVENTKLENGKDNLKTAQKTAAFGEDLETIEVDKSLTIKQLYDKISLYPNPAKESAQLQFNLEEFANADVQVFDATGKLIQNIKIPNINPSYYAHFMDLSQVAKGVYIVRVKIKEQQVQKKLVVN